VNQYDRDRWPALQARFERLFAARDRDAWAAHFGGTEACVTPVLTFAEARDHPQATERQAFMPEGAPAPAPRFDGEGADPQPASVISLPEAVARWTDR